MNFFYAHNICPRFRLIVNGQERNRLGMQSKEIYEGGTGLYGGTSFNCPAIK